MLFWETSNQYLFLILSRAELMATQKRWVLKCFICSLELKLDVLVTHEFNLHGVQKQSTVFDGAVSIH